MHGSQHCKATCLFGSSGTGKTSTLVEQVATFPGHVVVASVKADIADETYAARQALGPTHLIDPALVTGGRMPTAGFDWLRYCRDLDAAGALMEAVRGNPTGDGNTDWWNVLGSSCNQVYAYAYACHGYTVADFHRAVLTEEEFETRALLQETGNDTAMSIFDSLWNKEDRGRSSVFLTARQQLRFLDSPAVQDVLSRADFDPVLLSEPGEAGPQSLFVVLPVHKARQYGCLLTMLLDMVVEAALEREATRGPAEPSMLVVLDEVTAMALPRLPMWINTVRSAGIQLVVATQSVSALASLYGDSGCGEILASSDIVLLGGGRDPKTAGLLSQWTAGSLPERTGSHGEPTGQAHPAPVQPGPAAPASPYAILRSLPARGLGTALVLTDTSEPTLVQVPLPADRRRPIT